MEVYIYKIEYEEILAKEAEILEKLTADRREKVIKLKKSGPRAVSMAAGLMLQEVFLNEYGIELRDGDIITGDKGKLYCKEKHFNISHAGDFAAIAVSDDEVGIDIENKDDKEFRVTGRFFSEDEKAYVRSQEDFRKIWTMKEAYVKYRGQGLSIPLTSFSVFEVTEGADAPGFGCFDIMNGTSKYRVSVCTDKKTIKKGYYIKYLGCLFPYKVL